MSYGYCPKCGAPGKLRERRLNGDDICENQHRYPSASALSVPVVEQGKTEAEIIASMFGFDLSLDSLTSCLSRLFCGLRHEVASLQDKISVLEENRDADKAYIASLEATENRLGFEVLLLQNQLRLRPMSEAPKWQGILVLYNFPVAGARWLHRYPPKRPIGSSDIDAHAVGWIPLPEAKPEAGS